MDAADFERMASGLKYLIGFLILVTAVFAGAFVARLVAAKKYHQRLISQIFYGCYLLFISFYAVMIFYFPELLWPLIFSAGSLLLLCLLEKCFASKQFEKDAEE